MQQYLPKRYLKNLLVGYLSVARQELSGELFDKLDAGLLKKYVGLIAEAIPVDYLLDASLVKHAVFFLAEDYSVEETIMHVVSLYIYKLTRDGSGHPLERGVVRQQVIGLLPIFESAAMNGLIRAGFYEKVAEELMHIVNNSPESEASLLLLESEYKRFSPA